MSCPSTTIIPLSGRSIPPIRCSSVDLPDPDGPHIATAPPAGTSNETSTSAGTVVCPATYRRDTPAKLTAPRAAVDALSMAYNQPQIVCDSISVEATLISPGERDREAP